MTPEQINNLSKMLAETKIAVTETEEMLADFNACTFRLCNTRLYCIRLNHSKGYNSYTF